MSQTIEPRPYLGFTEVKIQQPDVFSASLSFLLEHAGPVASSLKPVGRINAFLYYQGRGDYVGFKEY